MLWLSRLCKGTIALSIANIKNITILIIGYHNAVVHHSPFVDRFCRVSRRTAYMIHYYFIHKQRETKSNEKHGTHRTFPRQAAQKPPNPRSPNITINRAFAKTIGPCIL
jgi:hypothetical protein